MSHLIGLKFRACLYAVLHAPACAPSAARTRSIQDIALSIVQYAVSA